jgi:hypothetical protein
LTGRTLPAFQRIYIAGYDMSGYANDSGEQGIVYPETALPTFADAVTGYLLGKPKINFGPLVAVLDNTATSGFHVIETAGQGAVQNVMLAYGMRAAPVTGDAVFAAPLPVLSYKTNGALATVNFGGYNAIAGLNYDEFWGNLVHVYGPETGANSGNTPCVTGTGETTAGGWMIVHIGAYAGTGSATISIDDSANGTSWLALSGATTGAIAHTAMPYSAIIQLGVTATVRQYLRFQVSLSTLTSVSFSLGFMRGR